jgi:hypothetical protein
LTLLSVNAFQPAPSFHGRATKLRSSIGGNGGITPPDENDNDVNKFLNPEEESENMKRARQYMSDKSLPISFQDVEEAFTVRNESSNDDDKEESSAMVVNPLLEGSPSPDVLQKNPYLRVVSTLSPSDLISKFTATADPRVQNAVRATILGVIGSLPKMAFDTTTVTTGQRLASLMFQLQMSGYMFKNAEYRLSLSQSLGMTNGASSSFLLTGSEDENDDENVDLLKSKVKGKLKIRYGNETQDGQEAASGLEMEVDAAAYMSELRSEVSQLRDELKLTRKSKDEELRKDLLTYIRTLPEQELRSLTNTISKDVLIAMKGLVNVVMSGIADEDGEIGPDTVTEQSGESMAQLCMWQLVVGYNLRELEVREEMKQSLEGKLKDIGTGVDFSEPGALE